MERKTRSEHPRTIAEMSTTRLIEMSRDLRDIRFDGLPLGRLSDLTDAGTQFGVCALSGRRVREEAHFKLIAIRDAARQSGDAQGLRV